MGIISTRAGNAVGGESHIIDVAQTAASVGGALTIQQQYPINYSTATNIITVDGVAASGTVVSPSQLSTTVPAGVSTGTGKVVRVVSNGIEATDLIEISSFDTDALLAFTAVEAAGGVLSATEKTAANALIEVLKSNNLWASLALFYPFLGGNAAGHAVNWRSPGTNNITWSGGVTHSANGVLGNTTNGAGATGYSTNNLYPNATFVASVKSRGDTSLARTIVGTNRRGIDTSVVSGGLGQNRFTHNATGTSVNQNDLPLTGTLGVTRLNASTIAISNNGANITRTNAESTTLNARDIPVMAGMNENSGAIQAFSGALVQGIMVYPVNITAAQLNLITDALQDMQNAIGR